MLKKILFRMAKSPFMGSMVGKAFQYCSRLIPVKKIYNGKEVIAFYHPQPSYQNHVIIVPKKAIKNLQQMASDSFSRYFVKIWETVKDICAAHPQFRDAFVIVANGGKRQEVQQVHFHMFTDHEVVNEYSAQEQAENVFYRDGNICILEHPNPNWEVHFVMQPISSFQMTRDDKDKDAFLGSVLHSIDRLNDECDIVQRGYSLVYQHRKNCEIDCPVFHIVSGKKGK